MATSARPDRRQSEIHRQVETFLSKSQAYRSLSSAEKAAIIRDTSKVVEAMAAAGPQAKRRADPYAVALENTPVGQIVGNAANLIKTSGAGEIGSVIGAGVTQAARMVDEIDFPKFVASLVEGTFHAIVQSSIEQMKAYAEMVRSVSTSLNEFKDQNTTENQARDHLVQKYPRHFQIQIINNEPRVTQREGSEDLPLPDFMKELGLPNELSELDDELIEEQLVPAARDDLARGRQQLLATTILMGINRIIVTDGKINAKIRFQFSANEKRESRASAFDYVNMGERVTAQRNYAKDYQGGQWNYNTSGGTGTGATYNVTSQEQTVTEPEIRVTSQVDTSSTGAIQASGQIMGEVSINFKSETFPLEKMVDTDQLMQLQRAQGAGRGALPAQQPAAAAPAPAAPAPVATPVA